MSGSGIGFGGFLLGLGGGWYLFRYFQMSLDVLSYIVILVGIGIIVNALLSKGGKRSPIKGLFGGAVGGLILALFLTQGFGFMGVISDEIDFIDIGDYQATENREITGIIEADKFSLKIDSVNGRMTINTWDGDDYKLELEIKARGSSTADAERKLDDVEHIFEDTLTQGVQELDLYFKVPRNLWINYQVTIMAYIPEDIAGSLDLDSTNGAITINDFDNEELRAHATNGRITCNQVTVDNLVLGTTNGVITGTIDASQANLDTTNGEITITVLGSRSGDYSLDTTNGAIEVDVLENNDIGYDLNLDSVIGSVKVDISGIVYTTDQTRNKIGQTKGYSSKPIQIEIDAETTIGNIEIN